jgi:hypothetical protein
MSAQPSELSARIIDLFGNPATADPTKLFGNLTVLPSGLISIGTGLTYPDGYTHSLTPMGRNRIINGDARITQRGANAVFTNGFNGYGGPDRFLLGGAGSPGGQCTQNQAVMTIGGVSKYATSIVVNTAATTLSGANSWNGIVQRIEGFNAFDLLGQQVTVSFWFLSNITGQYSVALADGTAANSCVATFNYTSASTPQKVIVTFPSLPTTLNTPSSSALGLILLIGSLNTGTYQAGSTGAWLSGNYFTASGNVNWAATAANYITATEIQLEPGNNATPFERRLYALEELLCQRYYQSGDGLSGYLWQGYTTNGSAENVIVKFWTPMRAAATVVLVGGGTNSFGTATVTGTPSNLGFQVIATGNATGPNGYFQGGYTASAEL